MFRHSLAALLTIICFICGAQAQVHEHGRGQAFVAQDNNLLVIELILPAADVLGFEHVPETTQQKETFSRFRDTMRTPENFIKLPSQCMFVSVKLSLPSDNSEEHYHHSDHDHGDKKESHGNVELSFEYRCQSTIESITFPILETYQSLSSLSVEWITESGQGAQNITSAKPDIRF